MKKAIITFIAAAAVLLASIYYASAGYVHLSEIHSKARSATKVYAYFSKPRVC